MFERVHEYKNSAGKVYAVELRYTTEGQEPITFDVVIGSRIISHYSTDYYTMKTVPGVVMDGCKHYSAECDGCNYFTGPIPE